MGQVTRVFFWDACFFVSPAYGLLRRQTKTDRRTRHERKTSLCFVNVESRYYENGTGKLLDVRKPMLAIFTNCIASEKIRKLKKKEGPERNVNFHAPTMSNGFSF